MSRRTSSCPPDLRQAIFERDDYVCAGCERAFAGEFLTLQHLIGRGSGNSLPAHLRWHPSNLISICSLCVNPVTDRKPGFEWLSVTRFGDLEDNLRAFWVELGRSWEVDLD